VIHDGMPYDLIQGQGEGQGHGGLKCVKMVDFKVSLASMQVIKWIYDTPRQILTGLIFLYSSSFGVT